MKPDDLVGVRGDGAQMPPVFGDTAVQPELLGLQVSDQRLDFQQLSVQPAQIVQRRRR